jgi:hypothetical protein
MAKPTAKKRETKSRVRATPARKTRRKVAPTARRKGPTVRKRVVAAKRAVPSKKQKQVVPAVEPRAIPPETRERFPSFQPPYPERVFDKRPMRTPRRPAAARFEPGHRTGAKKRLGRTG